MDLSTVLFNEFKNAWVLFMLIFCFQFVPKLYIALLSVNSKKVLRKISSNVKDKNDLSIHVLCVYISSTADSRICSGTFV